MKSMMFVILLVTVVLAGCSTSQVPQDVAVPQSRTENQVSLFDEAHRCQGIVKYQAEMQSGEMRSRLQCEWTVSPDEWGAW